MCGENICLDFRYNSHCPAKKINIDSESESKVQCFQNFHLPGKANEKKKEEDLPGMISS